MMCTLRGGLLLAFLCRAALSATDYEVFPLSGGVADGVEVSIKVSGFDDDASLEFLTAKRAVTLQWRLRQTAQTKEIVRSWQTLEGEEEHSEDWGAWPFDEVISFPVTFTFAKRKFSWAVTVNGRRAPWFDWNNTRPEVTTHVRVYSTFKGVEVLETRPLCTTECHPDECSDSDGVSTCAEGPCYSTMPVRGGISGRCTNTSTMPAADMHCCDGLPNQMVSASTWRQDWFDLLFKWGEVMTDAPMLRRACEASGYRDPEYMANCASLSGQQVQVENYFSTSNRINCNVPSLTLGSSSSMTQISLPAEVVAARKPNRRIVKILKKDLGGITVNRVYGFTNAVTGEAATTYTVPLYWFVSMMTTFNLDVWHAYSYERFEKAAQSEPVIGSQFVNLLLVNQQVETTACNDRYDDDDWKDSGDVSCSGYKEQKWCTELGLPTSAWEEVHANQTFADVKDNYHDLTPAQVCCACGGGKHDAPPEVQSVLALSV